MEQEIFEYIRLNYWSILPLTEEQIYISRKCQDVSIFLNRLSFCKDVLTDEDVLTFKEELNIQESDLENYTEELRWEIEDAHVKRIYEEQHKNIYFNRCPICGQLARTTRAKQAKCGHRWE